MRRITHDKIVPTPRLYARDVEMKREKRSSFNLKNVSVSIYVPKSWCEYFVWKTRALAECNNGPSASKLARFALLLFIYPSIFQRTTRTVVASS